MPINLFIQPSVRAIRFFEIYLFSVIFFFLLTNFNDWSLAFNCSFGSFDDGPFQWPANIFRLKFCWWILILGSLTLLGHRTNFKIFFLSFFWLVLFIQLVRAPTMVVGMEFFLLGLVFFYLVFLSAKSEFTKSSMLFLIQFNSWMSYAGGLWLKYQNAPEWFSGQALELVFRNSNWSRFHSFFSTIPNWQLMSLTWLVLLIELWIPIGVLIKPTRAPTLALIFGFHSLMLIFLFPMQLFIFTVPIGFVLFMDEQTKSWLQDQFFNLRRCLISHLRQKNAPGPL